MKLLTFSGIDTTDYYTILGVKRSSPTKEIRSAFKRLSKQYHPDVYDGSSEYYQKINEAYTNLVDPDLRMKYDSFGLNDSQFKECVDKITYMIVEFYKQGISDEKSVKGGIKQTLEKELLVHKSKVESLLSSRSLLKNISNNIENTNFVMKTVLKNIEDEVFSLDCQVSEIRKTITKIHTQIGVVNYVSLRKKDIGNQFSNFSSASQYTITVSR